MELKEKTYPIQIWPGIVRIFHWSLVIAVTAAYAIAWLEKEEQLPFHVVIGFFTLALVIWRIGFGWSGPYFLRFRNFVVSPRELFSYLKMLAKRQPPISVGHPPPAGWMIVMFMVNIVVISFSGFLLLNGEERRSAGFLISRESGELFRLIHQWSSWALLAMIFAHVCGVLNDSFLHRVNLIQAMFTGSKPVPESIFKTYQSLNQPGTATGYGRVLLVCILVGIMALASQQSGLFINKFPPSLVLGDNGKIWQQECGSCHQLYHPSLLPVRSWERMMAELGDHFGDDASIKESKNRAITDFLKQQAAENADSEAAFKFSRSIAKSDAPIAITETPYWVHKHTLIKPEVYKRASIKTKANCLACHEDAAEGGFEDDNVKTPEAGMIFLPNTFD
ncbi:MAG: cytochrome b/b6 domain-containing protein [SAR324 cluster bacterium]|nr:cytochrome b/b6 domain-containing protein [SAR324 cluster bacterium]